MSGVEPTVIGLEEHGITLESYHITKYWKHGKYLGLLEITKHIDSYSWTFYKKSYGDNEKDIMPSGSYEKGKQNFKTAEEAFESGNAYIEKTYKDKKVK